MGLIEIEGMEFYAYHGHFKEEQVVGNKFILDIAIETDTLKAGISDDLKDAVDYQIIYKIIKEEMLINANLLENVAHRIKSSLQKQFPQVQSIKLKISKINPPIGGIINKVSVTV